MILKRLWHFFERRIFPVESSPGMFNQYHDEDLRVDRPDAAAIRRGNLRNYIASFEKKPSFLLVGEAPGPWGCRFSGIPFTGEKQLLAGLLPFSGKRSSNVEPLVNLRRSSPYLSNSARIFWSTMHTYYPYFLVWNCVPFHPYKDENIVSVRTPTAVEVRQYSILLAGTIAAIEPEAIIAIGRKAQSSLDRLGLPCTYVRHPSQGGALNFRRGIKRIFGPL
jgi:uracil-DNA glycosylase